MESFLALKKKGASVYKGIKILFKQPSSQLLSQGMEHIVSKKNKKYKKERGRKERGVSLEANLHEPW